MNDHQSSGIRIREAGLADLDAVAPLYDLYRQFYQQPSEPERCRDFLAERLARGESVVLLAEDTGSGQTLGFTQLYPGYCSVMAAPQWVLYDLFVAPAARRRGVARALMEAAHRTAREAGARKVYLETAHSNLAAQALYESLGYRHDLVYRKYELSL